VSASFSVVIPGSAAPDAPAPATPRHLPNRGGAANPSADALRARFHGGILRVEVIWGETSVYVERLRLGEVVQWLHDDPSERYDYLSDVTAVEYRDPEQPLEVVWHLRSLPYRSFLRL
jgi:NADH-quinone oxidoreductase subunit C